MNLVKATISLALVVLTASGWLTVGKNTLSSPAVYASCVEAGDQSMDAMLYEDAYEKYTSALKIKESSAVREKQVEAYTQFYNVEKAGDYATRNRLLSVLDSARKAQNKTPEYAIREIDLYIEIADYSSAKRVCEQALKANKGNEEIQSRYQKILRSYDLDYTYYIEYRDQNNGYFAVSDGLHWHWLNGSGIKVSDNIYIIMGRMGTEGLYLAQREGQQVRFFDKNEVARGVTDGSYLDAGSYQEGLCPVMKKDGEWYYLNLKGEVVLGPYQEAGSFIEGKAAVKLNDQWILIMKDGSQVTDVFFSDIRLDFGGCWLNQGLMLAAVENGKYMLYDSNLKTIGSEVFEDVDVITEDGIIAVKQSGTWGFINRKGEMVVAPKYIEAKSYRNGLAAVKDVNGKWGFVKKNQDAVTGFEFLDAGYVSSKGLVMVSDQEKMYRLLTFSFIEDLVK